MSTLTPFLKRLGSLAGPDADALTPPLGEELAYDATDIFATFQKPAADAMAARRLHRAATRKRPL